MNAAKDYKPIRRTCFRASVDRKRPHELIGEYREDAAILRYRYTDDGAQVCVPNTWLNRPAQLKAQELLAKAQAYEERAARLEQCSPSGIDREAVEQIVARHRRKATKLRKEAADYQKIAH